MDSSDSPAVEVYRSSDLGFLFAADTTGVANGDLSTTSPGPRTGSGSPLAGSTASLEIDGARRHPVVVWDQGGRGQRREHALAENTIKSLPPCGNDFALGASDPAFALLGPEGAVRLNKAGVAADMRRKLGDAFQVIADGRQVRFGLGYGGARLALFDLASGTLTEGAAAPGLAPPRTTGIAVSDWTNTRAPKLAGKPLRLKQYETSRSLAIAPDARRFVLGTEWLLRAYDPQGREQWQKPGPGTAWGVNVTGDGRLVVTAYDDGTIRWHRMSDGEELLALFVHKDDLRWVAWTPSGYYMASPGGEDLIGWHVNRGWEQAADFFPASRFRERFNRPDVVQKILATLDERTALEEANRDGQNPHRPDADRQSPSAGDPDHLAGGGRERTRARGDDRVRTALALGAPGRPRRGADRRASEPRHQADRCDGKRDAGGAPDGEHPGAGRAALADRALGIDGERAGDRPAEVGCGGGGGRGAEAQALRGDCGGERLSRPRARICATPPRTRKTSPPRSWRRRAGSTAMSS